jgi:hypothetical protein
MSSPVKQIDVFDPEYRDRVRDAAWTAIIEATRDPTTNMAILRNYEIYDALLQIQAMILASSKEAQSPNKRREIYHDLAKRLRRHLKEFKRNYELEGTPFSVVHTDEMH